ncbi:MAG: hypothetical protein KJO98_13725 [Rhodothermia bacterium]|nr:hypothetical protein [Rhodothermia bacterium]
MHNYYETWVGRPMEDIVDYINRVDGIVREHGNAQTLWMAEVGYSTYRDGARVSDDYSAYYDYEHTRPYQAVDIVRRLTAALSTGKLSAIAWYEIKDLNPGELTIGDFENNGNLGVASASYEPKPGQQALAFFSRLTSEPMKSIDDRVKVSRQDDSDAHVYVFEQEDGDIILVGWLPTFVPEKRGDPGVGDHKDGRRETVSVTVPSVLAGPVTRFDETGGEFPFETVVRQPTETSLRLALSGGGVTIVHARKQ